MLPNFVWFTAPPANDILRAESVTPLLDGVGQVLQAVMAAALCAVVNRVRGGPVKGWAVGGVLCVALYLAGWAAYYAGITRPAVILTLCLAPCGAFLSFALARKTAPPCWRRQGLQSATSSPRSSTLSYASTIKTPARPKRPRRGFCRVLGLTLLSSQSIRQRAKALFRFPFLTKKGIQAMDTT